jgi:cyclopropane fatty-acyl-phospholipid synthase-like methyltransferase
MSDQSIEAKRLLELIGGYKITAVILTAMRLNLFEIIGKESYRAAEIAAKGNYQARALEIILDFLVRLELLKKDNGRYFNLPKAEQYLFKDSPYGLFAIFEYEELLNSALLTAGNIGQRVKNGLEYQPDLASVTDYFSKYMRAMEQAGRLNAMPLARAARLYGKQRILDLGGGPGVFSASLYRLNPQLEITLFELPEVIHKAEAYFQSQNFGAKITTVAGDFTKDDIGAGYDVVILSNILHHYSDEANLKLLKKIFTALNDSGMLLIHDFFLNEDKTGPAESVLFTIDWLTYGGIFNQSRLEARELLRKASFGAVSVIEAPKLPTTLIKASKK